MPLFPFSEDTKERIIRTVAVVHNVVHYGWVPFVLFVGYSRSTPRPSLIKLISPLA
ncbi:putative mitochondrial import receptor subunit tom7 [Microstroma glucosiphilum]|uniref:Putative mitochondrial import receptor subunit tom7 n=1 Tax=Pseudomicrostroma glucosiphilum TaxID=1684307 RepID=A0A316UGT7_9BASI|nr:putative mitochondrial import receptor subunit tom7 [Pseudomicrostroma glucosiphilum]PWN24148.1 putative mitochondrial import receptor subunit tom7 [Pseudomicrostroma glucosiphilum]